MKALRIWSLRSVAILVTMLAAVGAWEVYKGTVQFAGEARAQGDNDGDIPQLVREIHRVVVAGDPTGFRGIHFKCYQITPGGPAVNEGVTLFDQFHPAPDGENVKVRVPHLLCTPTLKIRPTG